MKKKVTIWLSVLLVCVVLFSSCADIIYGTVLMASPNTYSVKGIDRFNPAVSSLGVTASFLPEDFLSLFAYEDADFYFYTSYYAFGSTYESEILYIRFSKDIYDQAKEFFLENMPVDADHTETYKKYVFMENIALSQPFEETKVYLAYSDDLHILLAVGTYMSDPYTYATIGEYMETYFPFYNFEEGKIERSSNQTEKPNSSETTPFTGAVSKSETETEPPVKTKIGWVFEKQPHHC